MTPAQLHQAHTQGMSEREIDDQEAEDEAFQRVALQAQTPAPAQPPILRPGAEDHKNGCGYKEVNKHHPMSEKTFYNIVNKQGAYK